MAPRGRKTKKPARPSKPSKAPEDPKKRRPLNSFIGYRKHYSPIFMRFPGSQQKHASSLLTYMWQFEKSKAVWSALAQAWSIIRDFQGKKRSPLSDFIQLHAARLQILEPFEYLRVMGFGIAYDEDNQPSLKHIRTPSHHPTENSTSSVEEILRHTIATGYVDAKVLTQLEQNILVVQPQLAGADHTDCSPEHEPVISAPELLMNEKNHSDDSQLPGQTLQEPAMTAAASDKNELNSRLKAWKPFVGNSPGPDEKPVVFQDAFFTTYADGDSKFDQPDDAAMDTGKEFADFWYLDPGLTSDPWYTSNIAYLTRPEAL